MDKWGTNFDDQIPCGAGNAAIGLGGNDWLYSVSGTGPQDQILVGGAGNDTYSAYANTSTVILEKGDGYDTLNVAINAMSWNSYMYTIEEDVLMMGDYTTGCYIVIPDVLDFSIETINFLDASANFEEFYDAKSADIAHLSRFSSDMAYYIYNLALNYTDTASRYEYIGENQPIVPPDPWPQPPAPAPAPPSNLEQAVSYFFNETQYLQNKAAALQAGGLGMSVADTADAIAAAGLSVWDHYRIYGAFERNANGELGIDPSANFDTSLYYEAKAAQCIANGEWYSSEQLAMVFQSLGLDPITHYALYGQAEGIQPQPVGQVGTFAEIEVATA